MNRTPAAARPLAEQDAPPLWRSRRILMIVFMFVASLLAFFDRINISVLLANPTFNHVFGLTGQPVRKGELVSAFLVLYGLGSIFLGAFADWIKARRAMLLLVAVWTVVMGLSGFVAAFGFLLVFRGLLGVAEGPQFAVQSQFIKHWFPRWERARVNSFWQLGIPLGSALGIPLTVLLTESFGWRGSFFTFALVSCVVVLPLIWIWGRNTPRQASAISQSEIAYIESGTEATDAHPPAWTSEFGRLVRTGPYWLLFVFTLANTAYLYGLTTWLPSYLVQTRGFSMTKMGLWASLPFFGQILGMLLTGYIEDRWRRAPVCLVAYLCTATAMYLAVTTHSPVGSALLITLATFCYGASTPTVVTLAQDIIPRTVISTGIGISNGLGNFFSAGVPILMGAVIASTHQIGSGMLLLVADALLAVLVLAALTAFGY